MELVATIDAPVGHSSMGVGGSSHIGRFDMVPAMEYKLISRGGFARRGCGRALGRTRPPANGSDCARPKQ
jgi:hypothetical protein